MTYSDDNRALENPYLVMRESSKTILRQYQRLRQERSQIKNLAAEVDQLCGAATTILQAMRMASISSLSIPQIAAVQPAIVETASEIYAAARSNWVELLAGIEVLSHDLLKQKEFDQAWKLAEVMSEHGEQERSECLKRDVTRQQAEAVYKDSYHCNPFGEDYWNKRVNYRTVLRSWLDEHPTDTDFLIKLYASLQADVAHAEEMLSWIDDVLFYDKSRVEEINFTLYAIFFDTWLNDLNYLHEWEPSDAVVELGDNIESIREVMSSVIQRGSVFG